MNKNVKDKIYKISFYKHEVIYEIYAKEIIESSICGFIEVGELVFGTENNLVIDPAEERLKTEFTGVIRTFIPVHNILRIDEVEKEGTPKISYKDAKKGNITQFPTTVYTPAPDTVDS